MSQYAKGRADTRAASFRLASTERVGHIMCSVRRHDRRQVWMAHRCSFMIQDSYMRSTLLLGATWDASVRLCSGLLVRGRCL